MNPKAVWKLVVAGKKNAAEAQKGDKCVEVLVGLDWGHCAQGYGCGNERPPEYNEAWKLRPSCSYIGESRLCRARPARVISLSPWDKRPASH